MNLLLSDINTPFPRLSLSGWGGGLHESRRGGGLDTAGGSGRLRGGSWGLGGRGRSGGGSRSWTLHGLSRGLGLRRGGGLGGGRGLRRHRLGCWGRGRFRMSQFGLGDGLSVPVDADCDLHELAAILVPHVDAVLAGVVGGDFIDDQAGELPTVKRHPGVLVGCNFLLVFEPGDLWGRLAPHCAGQAQRLKEKAVSSGHHAHT